jgi:hypothetical protein
LPREVGACSALEDRAEIGIGDPGKDARQLFGNLARRRDGASDPSLGWPLVGRHGTDAEAELSDGDAALFQ